MTQHRILVTAPADQELSLKGVVHFDVTGDGRKLGELQVGRYGIAWKKRSGKRSKWTSWTAVERLLDQ